MYIPGSRVSRLCLIGGPGSWDPPPLPRGQLQQAAEDGDVAGSEALLREALARTWGP